MAWVSECMKKVHIKSLSEWGVRHQGRGTVSYQHGQCSKESTGWGQRVNQLGQYLFTVVSGESHICSGVIKNKRGKRDSLLNDAWKILHSVDLIMQTAFNPRPSCISKQAEIYSGDFSLCWESVTCSKLLYQVDQDIPFVRNPLTDKCVLEKRWNRWSQLISFSFWPRPTIRNTFHPRTWYKHTYVRNWKKNIQDT